MPLPVRRSSVIATIGHVRVGGDAPIVVQSMTNTDTADIDGTVAQVLALARAGSEIVRVTVNEKEAAAAVPRIRDALDQAGCSVPLVGDFHFNGHRLLKDEPACAEALAKLRINPGNVGRGSKRDTHVGVENMTVAVMGCVVNGPGESKHASIGISLPGTGERPVAPVYEDGEKTVTLKGDHIAEEFQDLVEAYIVRRYPRRAE